MAGRHAHVSEDGRGLGARHFALFFLRESVRVAFGGLVTCVMVPIAAILLAPYVVGDGLDMTDAPTCAAPSDADCLTAIDATAFARRSTFPLVWQIEFGDAEYVDLTFPTSGTDLGVDDTVRLLTWRSDPVAVADTSGTIVASLAWGRLHGLVPWLFVAVSAWGALVLGFSWLANRGKRVAGAGVVTRILAVGVVLAGGAGYLGALYAGYRGALAGIVLLVAVALIVAGLVVARRRRAARTQTQAVVQQAGQEAGTLDA